ncbi:hypothetical protein [Bradyrhizobium sp. HKCCYLRH3061]|uniref:hypothetical protein n=1 Tax=Bradyrhizobium sp. HKCCYLRH3061 TaxID=3420734 RepID=UPI003EB99DCF
MPLTKKSVEETSSAEPSASEKLPTLFQAPEDPQLPARELVSSGDPAPFGATNVDQLAGVAQDFYGAEPDLDASAIEIALQALAKVIGQRVQNPGARGDKKAVAIFIISERPRALASTVGAKHQPIIDDGSEALTGKLWISPATFVSGYSVELETADTASAFEKVSQLGLGSLAACVYNPAATQEEIRFYARGIDYDTHVIKFPVSNVALDFDTLDNVLDTFHKQNFITPDATHDILDPWKDARKYHPRANTEAFFQAWLKTALTIVFWKTVVVRVEIPGTEGRCDVLLMSRRGEAWLCQAVLELKVLRSLTSTGKAVPQTVTVRSIEDGLLQVVSYKTQNSAKLGMLCCYDMRKPSHCNDDKCFDPVRGLATTNAIHLRRYRVYNSSKQLRTAKYKG